MLSTEIATTTTTTTTDSKQKHTNKLLCFKTSVVENLPDFKKKSKQNIKMIKHRNDEATLLIKNKQQRQQQIKWLHSSLLFTLLAIFSITKLVVCQDFEDLNSNSNKQSPTFNNGQPAHHSFQPLNRLNPAQQQLQQQQQQSSTSNSRFTMQRPILSSRFAPSYSPSAGGGQQLAAQASSSSSIFSGPPNSLGASLQQPQQQQVSSNGGSGSSSSNSGASVSNIEQLMKNALARTAQLNSAASAEPRQDTVTPSQPEAPISTPSRSSVLQQSQQQASSTREAAFSKQQESNKNAEPTAETSPSEIQSTNAQSEDPEKSTTTAQATTTNGHETVYSEQRFANLFARRGNNKKSRITPSEQVKAKPTLPSFIKSPPDPKQFNAAQTTNQDTNTNNNSNNNSNNGRPVASSSSNSFASQRLQAQNQNRLNQINNQQKKPVITSNSAATANNKRNNLQNGNKQSSVVASSNSNPRLASNLNKTSTSKPNVPIPSNNNPFNKSQNLSSDPANVIAMARKRLLANNALESAKLKQQQQQQKQPN